MNNEILTKLILSHDGGGHRLRTPGGYAPRSFDRALTDFLDLSVCRYSPVLVVLQELENHYYYDTRFMVIDFHNLSPEPS